MLLGTNAAAMRADSIELVLVKCRVFHKSPVRAEDVCNPTIALGNLSHVRSQPHSCARNLELCDSVDAAETELAGLGNAILVETGNGDALLLDQLAARLARSNTTLLLGRQPGAGGQQPVGLVGEIELSGGFLPAQATAALDLSRECGGAPVLFAATRGFDLQDLRVLSELVVAAAVPTTVCMLAGIWHDPLLYQAAFVSNNFLLVVDPRGYGLDSELEDCQLAERCLPLLQQECARFVLGIHFSHAVQLRRYGGDGYLHTAKRFLSRLRMLGASPNELEGLCKTNALKALQYRQPIVVREVASTRAPWLCETCGASKLEGDEYFESHGKRFCRAKCMREFRLVHATQPSRDDGFGGGSKPSSMGTGNWGVSL